jgi:hypothetical protein
MTIHEWPDHIPRTPPGERASGSRFSATVGQTTKELQKEVQRVNPDEWRVHTGSGGSHTKQNGLPKASANPIDPGVLLRWSVDGEAHAVGSDEYTSLQSNLRELYLWFKETRMRGNRPVATASSNFAAAELPPGEDEAEARAADPLAGVDPYGYLGLTEDASDAVVEAAIRAEKSDCHPDGDNPDEERWRTVQAIENELLG